MLTTPFSSGYYAIYYSIFEKKASEYVNLRQIPLPDFHTDQHASNPHKHWYFKASTPSRSSSRTGLFDKRNKNFVQHLQET